MLTLAIFNADVRSFHGRCFNKAMTSRNDLSYVVGEGEDRWDCRPSDEDAAALGKYGLRLGDTAVECADVGNNCEAKYHLKKMH